MKSAFQTVTIEITSGEHFKVQIGTELKSGDLYYLGIDPRNRDFDCSNETGVRRLIQGWINTIIAAAPETVFYLPFDFSDEFTRWLECRKHASEITIICGWAPVEGWSFSPSEFSEYSQCLEGFRADEPANPQTFYTPRFLSDLRRSYSRISEET